mmetsp:Transcript_3839/g.10811  ORF Transcript_3839/g.10811 Transcript_3839/m.10811 type:complete len:699 (-) Transcript_3839:127-2223(-)
MEPQYVTKLHPNDVLFGRGSGSNDHEGNVQFRLYVAERKAEYMATNHRQTKARIAKEIVDAVYANNGRFLKKLEANEATKLGFAQGTDAFVVADEHTIMEKAKQALRQNRDKAAKGADGPMSPKRDRLSPVPSRSPMGQGMQGGLMGMGGPNMPDLSNMQHAQQHQQQQMQHHQPQQMYGNPGFPAPQSIIPGMGGMGGNQQIFPIGANGGVNPGMMGGHNQMQPPMPIGSMGYNQHHLNSNTNTNNNTNINNINNGNFNNQNGVVNNDNHTGHINNNNINNGNGNSNNNSVDNSGNNNNAQSSDGQERESEFLTYTTTLADTPDDSKRNPRMSHSGGRDSMQWMGDAGSRRGSLSGAVLGIGNGGRRGGSFLRRNDPQANAKRESLQVSDVFGASKRDSLQVTDVFAYNNMPKRASSITAASMQMSELMESFKGMSTSGDFQSDDDTIDTIDPIGMGPHHMSGLSNMSVMSISSATSLFKETSASTHSRTAGKSNMYDPNNQIKEEDDSEEQQGNEDQTNQQQQQQQQQQQGIDGQQNQQAMQGRPSDLMMNPNDGSRLSSNALRLSNLDDMSWAAGVALSGSMRQSIAPQDLWKNTGSDAMMRNSLQGSSANFNMTPRPLGSMQENPDNFSSLGSSGISFLRGAAHLESLENIGEEGNSGGAAAAAGTPTAGHGGGGGGAKDDADDDNAPTQLSQI